MRITVCLLFVLLFQAKAEVTYSQSAKISLDMNNATVEQVLSAIEEKSEFYFLYNSKLINVDRLVSVKADNQSIARVLSRVFDNTNVEYRVEDRQIILNNKKDVVAVAVPQQDKKVTGVVKDKKGETIIGANVSVKGTTVGTITDFDGNFTIDAPANATLVISYIGYAPQEIAVAGKATMNVIMAEDSQALGEVVVVGYGTQRKGEITSSVTSVKAADFNKSPAINPMQLVEGRVAGLTISRTGDPNATPNIQMRGASSLKGSNEPLIIIDGVPGNMSSLNAISPEDIEAMDVLKDGSAAAIYGTRGNNGVIIVTTKRPQIGVCQVDYSGYIMNEQVARRPDILTAEEFAAYGKETNNSLVKDYGGRDDAYDMLLNKGNITHVHNLSATGGNKQMNYRASLNYRKNEGIIKNSDRETINGAIAVNHRSFEDKLQLSFNLSNSYIKSSYLAKDEDGGIGTTYNDYDLFYQATRMNPTLPIYNSDGSFYETYAGYDDWNPIARLSQQTRSTEKKNLLGSFKAQYEIIPGLSVAGFFALEKNDIYSSFYRSRKSYQAIKDGDGGEAFKKYEQATNKTMEWTANYVTSINNVHNITGLLGYSYQDFGKEWFAQGNKGFLTDAFDSNNMTAGSYLKDGLAQMGSRKEASKLIAFFARANYNYDGKYLASASIRREGSSKFGANNKWAWFPSVSAGWMITREDFMENVEALDILKFRAGFGITGSLPNDPYISLIKYGTGAGAWDAYNNTWLTATYGPGNNPNPDLRWEKNKSLNIGFDYALFNNRLSGTIDWYQRTTEDLIGDYTAQQPSAIHDKIATNVGTMKNTGIEFALNAEVVKTKDFSYTASLTFTWEKNKLTSLSNDMYSLTFEDRYSLPSPGQPGYAFRLQEGHPVGSFFGYICDGLNEDGSYNLRDLNGNGLVDDPDRTWIGNGLPQFKAGLQNSFTYKNFDFSFFLRGMFDYDILNEGMLYFGTSYNIDGNGRNVYKYALDAKTSGTPLFSSYFLEKGNFLKIDNVTLGYTFNFSDNKFVRNLRVYGNVTNLATITGYSGLSPDINVTGLDAGIDSRGMYPSTRTFTLGVNFGF